MDRHTDRQTNRQTDRFTKVCVNVLAMYAMIEVQHSISESTLNKDGMCVGSCGLIELPNLISIEVLFNVKSTKKCSKADEWSWDYQSCCCNIFLTFSFFGTL